MLTRRTSLVARTLGPATAIAVALGAPAALRAQTPATPPQTETQGAQTLQLSMDQAVQMAINANVDLRGQQLGPQLAAQGVASAESAFTPVVTSSFSRNTQQQSPLINADGTITPASTNLFQGAATFGQNLPWLGQGYTFQWSGSRRATLGSASTFNPQLGSTFTALFQQPLWRGLTIDANRANLSSSQHQVSLANLTLQQAAVSLDAQVRVAYLQLIAAIKGREVAQQNMDIAQQNLDQTKKRVAVGTEAAIDIVQADAGVASNQQNLIIADTNIAASEDQLRTLILDPARPDYWTVHLDPTDAIQLQEQPVDLDAVIKSAMAQRLDLKALRENMVLTDLSVRLDRDSTHPAVNFQLSYSASGSGGVQMLDGTTVDKGFQSVLGDAFGGAFPSWTVGVNMSYPVGQSSAQAALAQAQLQKRQQALSVESLQLQITAEIRAAVRNVESNYKQVQAAQAAQEANQKQTDAEQKRVDVGLDDIFTLLTKQGLLAQSKVQALQAIINYNAALIQLARVQKIQ